MFFFFFSSRRRHTRFDCDWSSDVCSSDLDAPPPVTWSVVHAFGGLSGRQRRNFVPWRKRPCEKWSYCTSTTSLGSSGSHSPERSVLQRDGPPGARPVKPPPFSVGFFSFSIFGVSSARCFAVSDEQNPT